ADGGSKDQVYPDVASALTGVGTSITNVKNEISNQINKEITNVKGDSLLWSETDKAFSAQHGEGRAKSKIKFLANGDITEDSTDAINGSQLFATNQNVGTVSNNLQTAATKIAKTFGGDAKYENGEWTAPTFTLKTVNTDGEEKDEAYPDVAKALASVGSSITNVQNKITNEITNQINNAITKVEGESFIQQDKETNRLMIGAKTEGTEINIANASGASRIISGVADAKNSNEAVNKGQLDTSIKDVNNEITNKYNELTQNITHITQQVKGDALLWSESDNAFVAQHGEEKAKSKLKYLLNGDITAESTDAVNGSQLYSMSNNLAAYLSDGAGYDENGEWKAPTFTLKTVNEDGTAGEESYDTVEKALSAVGTSFTNIQNKITNEVSKEINKTKSDALLWSESDGAFVAQHGEGDKKAESKIMHLKAGDITAESTDAINGSQLYSVIHSLSAYFGGGAGYQNGQWKEPTFSVLQFKNDGNGDNKKDYHDVASAFEGVSESMKNINEHINNVAKDVSSSGLSWNEEEKAYDAHHNGTPSKIKHVADGDLSKDSKEAVNGSQLFETNNRVTKVEKRVDNIDQQIKNIENTVTNDAVKYDKNDKGDKINKVTLAGVSESDPVVLDNVAAGDLSKDSKQAVNGSQLWETNQKIDIVLDKAQKYTDERFNDIINHQMGDVINEAKSYTDMKFDALNYSIEGVRKEARQAAAIGIAVANLRYNETPGKLSVGFGTGLWRNKSAFAFGAGYTSESGSVLSNVSVTNSGGHWGIGAGFNMTLN
ncbi:Vomp family autotransporter, partial [Bartonella sp. ML70XJBT]|uniref:Vomp family autotransporter n=1 Tax=Bartonella sp. ML70XJBT TaxID=3019096 RepID=UPI0023608A13